MAGALTDPMHSVSALFQTAANILADPSVSRRKSRQDSNAMRLDPRVTSSLAKRKMALLAMNWSIVPEDDEDDGQQEAASELERMITSFDHEELSENLLEALWFGPGPAELQVGFDERDRQFRVISSRPIHGDSVVFRTDGTPFLRVGAGYRGNDRVGAFESAARPLTAAEREIFIMHTFNPTAAEFFTPEEAALIFHGKGLREDIWFPWWISHHIHQQWVNFLERYASGIVVILHEDTDEAREKAIEAVASYRNDNALLVPIHADGAAIKKFDVQVVELPANTAEHFLTYIENFVGKHIRHVIEGQDLTSETAPTGLGSGVAKAHQDTFAMFNRYDAIRLGRTLTEQLVWRLQRWNGILPDVRMKWEFAVEDKDPKEVMQSVRLAHSMGVRFIENQVRELTGLSEPTEDDTVIGGMMAGASPAAGQQLNLFENNGNGDRFEDRLNTLF